MGAWGKEPLENDDALDFVSGYGREGHPTWDDVRDELQEVIAASDYLEAPDASQAVAAAVLVASALGNNTYLPEPYSGLPKRMGPSPKDLISLANLALVRVRGENSELNELWREAADDYAGWLKTLDEIRKVLHQAQ